MEEDLDYYLAMEEDAQQEEEDWGEEGAMEIQHHSAQPSNQANSTAAPSTEATTVPMVSVTLPKPAVSTSLSVPATVTKIPTSLPTVPALSAYPTNKKLNPKEFAMKMSMERRIAMGEFEDASAATAGRKLIQMDKESEMYTTKPLYRKCHVVEKFLHDRPPALSTASAASAAVGSVPCVLADGSRVYLYKRRVPNNSTLNNSVNSGDEATSGLASPAAKAVGSASSPPTAKTLLSKSMVQLMREADALKARQLVNRENVLAEKAAQQENNMFNSVSAEPVAAEDGSLWVDKYAPHSFTQLLSPEKINREVLKALKKWDRYVFKGDEEDGNVANSAHQSDHNNSEDPRPKNKVILLCGPPGTGKTTLAHIVARHCGYNAIEINASDDRSPEKLRDSIYNATQNTTLHNTMTSVNTDSGGSSGGGEGKDGKDHKIGSRPNLIILDEIDGIDGSRNSLDVLTNIIKQPLKNVKKDGKKSQSSTFPLTRPLICICNDQYAPALRELIKLADVFVFTAPKDVRLIARLRQVCKAENLTISNSNFITELCGATGYDIRASINNLQFAALKSSQERQRDLEALSSGTTATAMTGANNKGGSTWGSQFSPVKGSNTGGGSGGSSAGADKALDIGTVLHSMIKSGLKDDTLDLAQIWKQMFTVNTATSTSNSGGADHEDSTYSASSTTPTAATKPVKIDHAMRCMDSMMSYGDHNAVIGGIYENVHSMESVDPSMNKRTILADWLSYSEELLSFMPRARDGYQVMPYVAAIAGVVYTQCAVATARRVQIEWPRRDKEMHFKGVQKQNILQSLCDGRSLHSLLASKQRIVLDFLPFLMDIITPSHNVRPLPFITLPVPEQHAITSTIRVMEHCGLSYLHTKVIDASEPTKYPSTYKNNKFSSPTSHTNSYNNSHTSNYSGYHHQDSVILKLDPAFDQLLVYPECEELAHRRSPVSAEMRQLLYTEQRKYSIQLKASKLAGEAHASKHPHTTSSTTSSHSHQANHSNHPNHSNHSGHSTSNKAHASAVLDTESTPYLMMQQQQAQRDLKNGVTNGGAGGSGGKRLSGVMEGFFTKSAAPSKKAKAVPGTPGNHTKDSTNTTLTSPNSSSTGTAGTTGVPPTTAEKKAFNVNTIRFKFNQGFSNAVKRSVTMDEWL